MPRQAKPINLHLLEGNKNRLTKEEIKQRKDAEESIQFKSDNITPPGWLSPEAKEIFTQLTNEFISNKILVNVDIHMLAWYADAYMDYINCTRIIEEEGLLVEYTNKAAETNKVAHPLFTKKKQSFEQMNKIAGEFGLSPAARAKLAMNLTPPEEKDKDNKFSDRV
ncbi:phage terminase small subunit P27 family [Alkalihalophilus marmarensis]|uniref:phage terminase small subunit P27 family n=1 Tax=Alkalihalophilus marmarensis TaxID=521377 RepID=UPI0003FECDCA|nr:phage terminase small subunit P27 family [Alkalihalophilus marmarensis]